MWLQGRSGCVTGVAGVAGVAGRANGVETTKDAEEVPLKCQPLDTLF